MNSVSLIGRLTTDPEPHTFDADGAEKTLARFRLAVDRGGRDGTDFFDVVAFGGTATAMLAHVGKGRRVGVNGRLQSTEWETEDGTRRYGTEIRAAQVDFLEKPHAS